MNNQNKSISNSDSIIQHFEKSDVITESLKQFETPTLTWETRNWITDWTTIRFKKFRSKSLPQLIFEDADFFFLAYENDYFNGRLEKEARELYKSARSIKVPPRNGKKMLVQYAFSYNVKLNRAEFAMMELIPDGSDRGRSNVSLWIDFYVPRSRSHFDKTGYRRFVMGLKSILFNHPLLRMNSLDCERFFNNYKNFDLRRVRMMQL